MLTLRPCNRRPDTCISHLFLLSRRGRWHFGCRDALGRPQHPTGHLAHRPARQAHSEHLCLNLGELGVRGQGRCCQGLRQREIGTIARDATFPEVCRASRGGLWWCLRPLPPTVSGAAQRESIALGPSAVLSVTCGRVASRLPSWEAASHESNAPRSSGRERGAAMTHPPLEARRHGNPHPAARCHPHEHQDQVRRAGLELPRL
jgi:hypothetical protein